VQPGEGPPTEARPGTPARLFAAFRGAGAKYGRDRCPQLAAAISYHVLFSLVPLTLVVVSIAGIVLRDEDVRAQVVDHLLERFPLTEEAGVDLERILATVPTPASGTGLVALLGLLWSASGMMASIRIGLTAAFADGTERPFFQSKLVDTLLLLAVAIFLLASFGLSVAVHAVQRMSGTVSDALDSVALGEWGALGNVAPLLLAFPAFVAVYHLVPPSRPRVRDVWVGALVASIAFVAVNLGFSFYLATVATWDAVYGSLGSILAFLLVVYLEASVLLFGGELASEWPRSGAPRTPSAETPVPLTRQLLRALRGLFVRDSAPG
jgi:membrane protein